LGFRLENEKNAVVTVDRVLAISKDFPNHKGLGSFQMFPSTISLARVLACAYMSGDNNKTVSGEGFMKAVRLFGLDCPMPPITRRLALYGNTQDVFSGL
jgi:hypothetical protein